LIGKSVKALNGPRILDDYRGKKTGDFYRVLTGKDHQVRKIKKVIPMA